MKIYKITGASEYIGVSINTLKMLATLQTHIPDRLLQSHYAEQTPSATGKREIVLYQTEDGKIKIDTVFQDETIWLSQARMAELFDVNVPAISKHLNNIFEEGELQKEVADAWGVTVEQAVRALEGAAREYTEEDYERDRIDCIVDENWDNDEMRGGTPAGSDCSTKNGDDFK